MRTCPECGALFTTDKRGSQTHCSKYCAQIAANKKANLKWASKEPRKERKNSLKHTWSIHNKKTENTSIKEF
jgi:hypothetical protein